MAEAFRRGSVDSSGIVAGDNFVYLGFEDFDRIAIHTESVTNVDVTVEGTINGTHYIDVTNELFNVTTLAANSYYSMIAAAQTAIFQNIRIKYVRTDASNVIKFNWAIKKS